MTANNPNDRPEKVRRRRLAARALLAACASSMLASCVQVTAPDRPIDINLNIVIRQEVVVRLQQDVRELINSDQRDF